MTNNNPFHGLSKATDLAKTDFERARTRGFWLSVSAWFRRRDNELVPFDEVRRRLPTEAQHYAGNQEILLDKIMGSVGRYQDFDRAFLPKHSFLRSRWESVDRAQLQDIQLPSIEVYKLGPFYFVKDGNHRVSVARERGQVYIDAVVTEIEVSVPVDENTNIDDLISRQEAANFLKRTHLDILCPGSDVHLTLPGQYSKLMEHIQVHRWYMGEAEQHPISLKDAVQDWYAKVYSPLVEIIRQQGILAEFPGRSEADLYLWIIEHLWFLREQYSGEVSLETAVSHFANEYSRRPFHRIWVWIKAAFAKRFAK
jgi:hypothetical protein